MITTASFGREMWKKGAKIAHAKMTSRQETSEYTHIAHAPNTVFGYDRGDRKKGTQEQIFHSTRFPYLFV